MTPLAVSLTSLLSFSGLACLCLSMDRHGRTLFHGRPSRRRDTAFRVAGWLFIALAFAAAVVTANWNFGPVQWLGSLTGAALIVVALMFFEDKEKPVEQAEEPFDAFAGGYPVPPMPEKEAR